MRQADLSSAFGGVERAPRRAGRDGPGHPPTYVSPDHDPPYRFHQWEANLRILYVKAIKTVPYVPLSHPFVERLIGTIRRESLDRLLFWTTADPEMKLLDFQHITTVIEHMRVWRDVRQNPRGSERRTSESLPDRWQPTVVDCIKRRSRRNACRLSGARQVQSCLVLGAERCRVLRPVWHLWHKDPRSNHRNACSFRHVCSTLGIRQGQAAAITLHGD